MKKLSFNLVIVIIFLAFFSIIILLLATKVKLSEVTTKYQPASLQMLPTNSQLQQSIKRGTLIEMSDDIIYQLPVTALTNVVLKDQFYQFQASPFGNLSQELTVSMGPKNIQLSFGKCKFDDKGTILSDVSWVLKPIEQTVQDITVGSRVLLRLIFPVRPQGDKIRYKEELLKKIEKIENQMTVDRISTTTLCVLDNSL